MQSTAQRIGTVARRAGSARDLDRAEDERVDEGGGRAGAPLSDGSAYNTPHLRKIVILMTDGELTENDYLITANNSSRSLEQLETVVESIDNLDAAIAESIREAERATAAGIFVPGDAWMFRFRVQNGTGELKAFPGDFDCVAQSSSPKLAYKNLLELFGAFLESLYFIPDETLAGYKHKIKERFLAREPRLAEEL